MIKSIQFEIQRAQASSAAQGVTGATKIAELTVEDWGERLEGINTKVSAEASARITLQGVAAAWSTNLTQVFDITRHAVVLAKKRFQNDPAKLAFFANLTPSDNSRAIICKVSTDLIEAWQKADAAWTPVEGATLPVLKSLLTQCGNDASAHAQKLAQWRASVADLNAAAEALHDDNVTWYAAATRQFREGTTYGDMIRSTVPVTTEASEQVGQAVITNLLVAGSTARFDAEAPHATTYTYLQKKPGESVWAVVQANTPETSVTLAGLTPGEHRFKAFGANAQGIGPESAEAVVAIAQANAA